nr:xanthine dehydrogenase accessory protein XdhC [Marivita sp. GX14005]
MDAAPDVVRVRIVSVRGSTPRNTDAVLYVAPDAVFGTIGGGQLEYMAIDRARAMLRNGEAKAREDVALGPDIGQCCGGRVELAFDRLSRAARQEAIARQAAERAARPSVYICGAGHVGRALAGFFALLPVQAMLLDSRAEELALCEADVRKILTPLPEAEIRAAPPGSAFIVLTHDHALDYLLTAEALARPDAAYVGLIGSATKRARFNSYFKAQGCAGSLSRLVCPIGATGSADKRPEVIAAFVASEVMTALTRHENGAKQPAG